MYVNVSKILSDVKDVMHWVDPERQIYLVISKFKSYETLDGTFTDVTIRTYYDAETGDELGYDLKGKPPEDFKSPLQKHSDARK